MARQARIGTLPDKGTGGGIGHGTGGDGDMGVPLVQETALGGGMSRDPDGYLGAGADAELGHEAASVQCLAIAAFPVFPPARDGWFRRAWIARAGAAPVGRSGR